ncbi:MAG: Dam family site-specific DNA-(adenine-N6)-methyltransferase [archaeon]|jgi:DNA adenine methylase|nr:Dam family site-specific DNA-(adenine-N6)-methyltransferase [archaeon]MCK9439570.1 Dam family site-specific DNA-(adenine-N6)-methyltransferase [Patescibacteria group bacterium]MDD4662931.1 Dam family site-specific DNA-(adenine-N6)-methyltransferase [Candidatus ainarchaeum sp.]
MKVKPFIKWAGGKTQLINKIEPELPIKINRYFEPFLGGGSVLLFILQKYNPKEVIVSDVNYELINTYNIIKNNVEELINYLEIYKNKHSEKFYYTIRGLESTTTKKLKIKVLSDSNLSEIESAAKFIYLNKTCFNGLYRVNKENKFNVPLGKYKNPEIYNKENLLKLSKLLKNIEIKCFSYEKIKDLVKKDDFIYFDPPYDQINNNSFTTYTEFDFIRKDQEKLKDFFDFLNKKGCKVLLSNSSTDFIKSLYKNYTIKEIDARRMINSDSSKRGNIKEVLIKNY